MGRILAIDFGGKRSGIAVTDPLKIIATPLGMLETSKLLGFLKEYMVKESVEELVIGFPKDLRNQETDATAMVNEFVLVLGKHFPELPVYKVDERFSSKIAVQAMVAGGMKKKQRRQKGEIDKISAVIILQSYMQQRGANQ